MDAPLRFTGRFNPPHQTAKLEGYVQEGERVTYKRGEREGEKGACSPVNGTGRKELLRVSMPSMGRKTAISTNCPRRGAKGGR